VCALSISETFIRAIFIADSARVIDFFVPEARQSDNL
jgi:hypothetical protein